MDLSALTLETFLPYLNQSFGAGAEGIAPFRMELIEASPLRGWTQEDSPRKGFDLMFKVVEGEFRSQATLTITHTDGSRWVFFCVPVLVPKPGRYVQAIFN